MQARIPTLMAVTACALTAAPAGAQQAAPDQRTIAANGTGAARVNRSVERTDEAIAAAVARARERSIPLALAAAGRQAGHLAAAARVTLGAPLSIEEGPAGAYGPWFGPYGGVDGTFGPGRYCGIVGRYRVVRDSRGPTRRVRIGSRRTCRIPREIFTSVRVTYPVQGPLRAEE